MSSLILGQLRHLHDGVSVGYLARGRVRANFGTSFLQVTHTRLRQVCSVTRGHLPGPFGGRLPAAAKIGNVKEVGRFDVDVDTVERMNVDTVSRYIVITIDKDSSSSYALLHAVSYQCIREGGSHGDSVLCWGPLELEKLVTHEPPE
jgi:hypothetical protein